MKYLISLAGIVITVFIVGIFLAPAPVARSYDSSLLLKVPMANSSAWRFTEGYAISRFGKHGFNAYLPENSASRIYLHGDSYVEALQVSDDNKPDAVMTRFYNENPVVYGYGRSGTGLPSFIVHARECERAFGKPLCHVFFVTSISSDIFDDSGVDFVWEKEVLKTNPNAAFDSMRDKSARIFNQLHLNFISSAGQLFSTWLAGLNRQNTLSKKNSGTTGDESLKLRQQIQRLVSEMKKGIEAPCVIAYCPFVPSIANGEICQINEDSANAILFREIVEHNGFQWVDTTPAMLELFKTQGVFARGFANCSKPGNGHLNKNGIDAVFTYVAAKVKELYVF